MLITFRLNSPEFQSFGSINFQSTTRRKFDSNVAKENFQQIVRKNPFPFCNKNDFSKSVFRLSYSFR